jgi:hypothetical protein
MAAAAGRAASVFEGEKTSIATCSKACRMRLIERLRRERGVSGCVAGVAFPWSEMQSASMEQESRPDALLAK